MIKRIFAAMDLSSYDLFLKKYEKISSYIELFKVGYELFYSEDGERVMDFLASEKKQIFLDLKMNDIPTTMEKGLINLNRRFSFNYITAHISSGEVAMKRVSQLGKEMGISILGVSLLTSLSSDDLISMGIEGTTHDSLIRKRIESAYSWGVPGVILSAADLPSVKDIDIIKVTPGIRFQEDSADDQKRVATPAEAFRDGADMLVMGRSLFKHPVERMLKELEK